jgi:hypothetical protein
MKKQIFKFTNHTVTYLGGGKYKLDADAGYVLKSKNGQKVRSVETRDYTEWSAVEESAEASVEESAEEARKTKNKQ